MSCVFFYVLLKALLSLSRSLFLIFQPPPPPAFLDIFFYLCLYLFYTYSMQILQLDSVISTYSLVFYFFSYVFTIGKKILNCVLLSSGHGLAVSIVFLDLAKLTILYLNACNVVPQIQTYPTILITGTVFHFCFFLWNLIQLALFKAFFSFIRPLLHLTPSLVIHADSHSLIIIGINPLFFKCPALLLT